MRAATTNQTALLGNVVGYATWLRVKVADSTGTLVELDNYSTNDKTLNFVDSFEYSEVLDMHVMGATLTLAREIDRFSLAPMVQASKLNRESGVYVSGLLRPGRRVTVETALIPQAVGSVVDTTDWTLVFDGFVDKVNWAQDPVTVECRDEGSRIVDTYIEKERVYGYGTTAGLNVWEPSLVSAVGNKVMPSKPNGHYYNVSAITTGIAGTDEPGTGGVASWPTSAGSVTSGGVTYTWVAAVPATSQAVESIMQALLDDNLGAGVVTLYTQPGWTNAGVWAIGNTSPLWLIKGGWRCQRQPLMTALTVLSDQIGASLRYKWRSAFSRFDLTFFEPDRGNTTADYTFTPSVYRDVRAISVDRANVRNVVEVTYFDASVPDNTGQPSRRTVTGSVAGAVDSITSYGRRFMSITEAANSQIDSSTEAQKMADAALADLMEPNIDQEVDVDYFPLIELTDLYQWNSNNWHYDSNQKLAVQSFRHKISKATAITTIVTRGKPATGLKRWHEKASRPGVAPPVKNGGTESSSAPTVTAKVAGGVVDFVLPSTFATHASGWGGYEDSEVHLSPSNNFTPSSGTLKARGRTSRLDISDLLPGTTYYARVIHRDRSGKVSAISPQTAFTTSYVDGSLLAIALVTNAKAGRSANLSMESNVAAAYKLAFDNESVDLYNIFNTGTNRFENFNQGSTGAGRWRFDAQVTFSGCYPGNGGYLQLYKNGVAVALAVGPNAVAQLAKTGDTSLTLRMTISTTLDVVNGDYIECWWVPQVVLPANLTFVAAQSWFEATRLMQSAT